MANILMINIPYAGHTNPTLPLAECLVQRGHHVSYINAEKFRTKIMSTGADFIPYINYPEAPGEQQKKTKCFRAAYETALSLTQKFDLLIYEMFFYPGIAVAEKLNIPCVRQFSQPAWNHQMTKSASKFFQVTCKLIDVQIMGKKNVSYMGLKNKNLVDAVLNDKPNLNVVYVPEAFQKNRESFGEDFLFTVPQRNGIVGKAAESEKTTEMGKSAGVQIPYSKMTSPMIYISLGSIISSKGFCRKCIRGFGNKNVSVILNTGKIKPETLGKIPDNIYAYSFVPQLEVLKHADVFVTHCGMNSVNEAIAEGVPMVAMPFINDQISNADRIMELGLGRRLSSFTSTGKDIYNAVSEVLNDQKIKEKSKAVQENLKQGISLEGVAKAIEKIL